MQSLNSYINNTNKINENINESELFINYGKDIDNVLYKFETFTKNQLTNKVNESSVDLSLSNNEVFAVNNLFKLVCEDYRNKLQEELTLCEQYLNDELTITESELKVNVYLKNLFNSGKEKVKQAVDATKTKIKELNNLIAEFAAKTINSIKGMAIKLMDMLSKLDCTIEELFKKMGFDTKKEEESFMASAEDIAKHFDKVKENDIYESYGKQLKNQLLFEDEEQQTDNKDASKDANNDSKVVDQGKKVGTKEMLWKAFKEFLKWAVVCVVIPGTVCAFFPGTFLALLVPIACKLAWNGYKIVKIYKQFKKVKSEWKGYSKVQKWITVIGMVASIIAIGFNFHSSFVDGGKVLSAFAKTGGDLLAKAELGVQPDILTRGFAAFISMIKEGKFSMDDFGAAFKNITDSFAEHTQLITEKVVKATAKIGKSADEVFSEYTGSKFKTSTEAWTKFLKPNGIPIDKVPKGAAVDVVLDGSSASKGAGKLIKFLSDNGYDVGAKDALNGSLNKICKNAGSIWSLKGVPVDLLQKAQDAGIELGHNGWFSILGGVADASKTVTTITDVITAATSMLMTIPSVELTPENAGGFRVRLGEEGSNNFVYEVDEKGVREESFKDTDKINALLEETKKYYETLENSAESDEEKNKVKEEYEKFKDEFNKNIKDSKRLVFYGKKVEEETKTEESYISFHDYIIKEAEESNDISIDDIKQNITDLKNYLDKIGKDNEGTDAKGKKLYAGNVQILLQSIFSFNKDNKTHDWDFDKEYKATPYDTIKKRIKDGESKTNVFGPEDIDYLAVSYCIWYGPDNEESYEGYRKAFIDLFVLRKLLMNSDSINDTIIAAYDKVIENLKQVQNINNDIKDKEWKPKENWAPIKFDENKVDTDAKEKVEQTEDNNLSDNSKEEAEKELKNDKVPIPDEEDKKDEPKDDDNKDDTKEEPKDTDEVEILEFIPFFNGYDIAKANDKGPRKDSYSLKGCFIDLEFIVIKKGTSLDKLETMLGDMLYNFMVNNYNLIADKPCIKEKDADKFKVNENSLYKPDDERPELGNFTNNEITDILNNKKNAYKYLSTASSKIKIAKTKKEEEQIEELKKKNETLKDDPDFKEQQPDLFDKDGKIIEDKWNDFNTSLSNWQLGNHKKKKSKGFFSKLWDNIKSLFGFKTKDLESANDIVCKKQKANESLNESVFNKRLSLKDYIKQNM